MAPTAVLALVALAGATGSALPEAAATSAASAGVPAPLPQACVTPTTCTVPLNKPLQGAVYKPLFPPTYLMNESTIVIVGTVICNHSSSAP